VRRLSALRLRELALSPDCTLATISHYHQPGKSAGNSTRAMALRPLGAGHVPTAPAESTSHLGGVPAKTQCCPEQLLLACRPSNLD